MRARKGFTYGVTQEELRRHNLSTLLSYVHQHGPTSRAVLTASMSLNRSSVQPPRSRLRVPDPQRR